MIDTNDVELAVNTAYSVTVGAGGVASSADNQIGGSGGSSSISALEVQAEGGGGGGGYTKAGSAGGSGGNGPADQQALGGSGGGGAGGYHVSAVKSTSGENGQGGGGGSGAGNGCKYVAGAGGSGIVIIRYHYTAQGEKDKIVVPLAITGLVYYVMGSILTAENAGTLNFDGVTMANSTAQWGLVRVGGTTTVNLRNCNIYGISVSTSAQANGSVLHLSDGRNVLNVYGGSITNNAVTKAAGYGQVYCKGTVNFFGGKPIIQDFGVSGATNIRLDGTLDDDASVGVIYGAAAGDQFGTYVSGDRMSARAFYPTWSDDPKLRGGTRGTKLVWKTPTGLMLFVW